MVEYAQFGNGHPPGLYVKFSKGAGQLIGWVGFTRVVLGPYSVQVVIVKYSKLTSDGSVLIKVEKTKY